MGKRKAECRVGSESPAETSDECECSPGSGRKATFIWWGLIGLALIGLHLVLALLSRGFAYGSPLLERPIIVLVLIQIIAGLLYLLIAWCFRNVPCTKSLLVWAIFVGIAMRLPMLVSTPILEDDYYRYLWDGAVLANGFNPYDYTPEEAIKGQADNQVVPEKLKEIALDSEIVIRRVNHPHLRTIYPPVAQAAFAAAYFLKPWSLFSWRIVLLGFDSATLCLLIALLRAIKLPRLWLVIYWWNPLAVKEIFNSGHMDVIALPFLLGAILLSIRRKHILAAGVLALAVASKIWPIVLLPLILRPTLSHPRKLIFSLLLFVLLSLALFFPVYAAGLDDASGFAAYSQFWEINDALFMIFVWGSRLFLKLLGLSLQYAQLTARLVVIVLLLSWIIYLVRNTISSHVDMCRRSLLILAAVFLLSPAQFPWYFIWLLPLLAIQPRLSLLLLTALLPLYYLRFYFTGIDRVGIFDYGIVWLEFLPVWCLLIWEWLRGRKQRPFPLLEVGKQ